MSAFHKTTQETGIFDNSRGDYSTAERFYDLEESQRHYQELVEENMWLKKQIDRSRPLNNTTCPQCNECTIKEREPQVQQGSDVVLWSMLERNKYLESKIDKLKGTYEKQSRTLQSIRNSDKWKNRFLCSTQGSTCYEDKYLQLLRVRSPFY